MKRLLFRRGFLSVFLFLALIVPAEAAITLTQHAGKDAGSVTSSSQAFASSNTAGNFIAVVIRSGLSGQTFNISDSRGNTYRQAVQLNVSLDTPSGDTLAIYYAESIAGGANTVTVGQSMMATLRFAILEYSGVAASNSLDGTVAAQANNSSPNSGSVTTTTAGDLLLGAVMSANGRTYTAGTSFTIQDRVPAAPNTKLISEDRIQSSAGSAAATAILSASDIWGAELAAFRPATVVVLPDLVVAKSHAGSFTQGQTGASYSIAVSNVGAGPTGGTVTLTDTLPAGLTATALSGTGWNCTVAPASCTRSDILANGASYPAITLTVNVASNAAGSVTNTATVSGGGETNTANNTASDVTMINAVPDLTVAKSHTGAFTQGQTGASYTVAVTNSGPGPTSGTVTMTDTLPAGLTATAVSGSGWNCTVSPASCNRSDALSSGSSYPAITVTVNVASNAPGTLTNTASVSGGGEINTANDSASDVTTINAAPDLTIAKSHTGAFTQGQTGASYTVTVTNNGPGATSGTVTMTDTLPAGLTATALSGSGWNCTVSPASCNRNDTLVSGASYPAITVTVNVASNAPGTLTNTASVSGGGEINTANDSASDVTTINADSDLTVSKSHIGSFTQGQTGANYSVTVTNSGPAATSGTVTLTDTLPAGLTATALSGTGWNCTVSPASCNRSDALASGASYPAITVTVNVASNAPGTLTNTVSVSGGSEINTANDSASDVTTINGVPDLTLTKTHTGAFTQGQTGASYTVTVMNGGLGATSGTVTITDALPAGLTATALTGSGWSCTVSPASCNRSDALASGASYPAITVTVNVASNAPGTLTNTASVSGGGEINTANDNASDVTTINAVPDLTIAKAHTGAFTQGQTGASYTVTVTNNGPGATSGAVTMTDTLPAGLSATAVSGTGWNCTVSPASCNRSDALASGATYPAITVIVSVASNAPGTLTNTASVSGGGEINTANNSASDVTTINAVPDLTIAKTHTGAFTQGQTGASYTVTVTNNGPGATSGTVTMTDTLPAGLTATALSGSGWNCTVSPASCNRSDALASVASYPAITVTVNVASNAPGTVTNTASVSGGGEVNTANDSASDATSINTVSDLTVTKTHSGSFTQGQTGAGYTITVTNSGTGATNGTVAVIDTLPPSLTANALSGSGWSCTVSPASCTRGDTLASGASYPAISLTVSVAANAPGSVTNSVSVSGGGEINTANNSASDVTTINALDSQPPSAPGTLLGSASNGTHVDLTWGAATDDVGVTDYRVERCDGTCTIASGGFLQIATPSTTGFTDGTALPNTTYSYAVRAEDAANNLGQYSNVVTVTTPAAIPELILAFSFDEPSGSTVTDSSGKGNTGTISNATRTLGKYGNALSFNGTNALVNVVDSTSLHLTNAMTLEAWVNPTTASPVWRDVIYKGDDSYYLEGTSMNGGSPAGGTVGSANPVYGTSPLPINTWSHLALTYDGTALRLYVNGTLAGSLSYTGGLTTSANPLQIGGDSIYGQFFSGLIDEVRVYNIALTPAQIQSDMNSPIGGAYPVASLNPASLNFGNVTTGNPSTPQNVTLTNNGGAALSISGISIVGTNSTDFSQTNNCAATLVTNASCAISVTFTPTVAGARTASVQVADNASGSPQLVSLAGSGQSSSGPDLTLTKTHTGTFTQGQTGATYSLVVRNSGAASTSGTVTVTDTLPTGLTATALSGTGWTCTLSTRTCTRSTALAANSNYPTITLIVSVAANAPSSATNTAAVSGGGETNTSNDSASDITTISPGPAPDMTLTKSHSVTFTQGQVGATYSLVARNSGTATTSGTVTVVDTLPGGLTATALSGTGWTCSLATLTCTRSSTLAANSSYPTITLSVSVASNAPGSVTNTATVSGGGETNTTNDSASDPTTINPGPQPDLTITKTHTGTFTQGQSGATYSLVARNSGTGATSGTVTVVDTLPAGLTATSLTGTGWNCVLSSLTCSNNSVVAASTNFPAITLVVDVAANAPASLTNTAAVSGGSETNTSNNNASDVTSITAPDNEAPSAPGELHGNAPNGTHVDLTWGPATDNVGVTDYRVERCDGACTVAGGGFVKIAAPLTTSYSDSGLAPNTTYSYVVRAEDAASNLGPYSNVVTVTTLATIPELVVAFSFDEPSGATVTDSSGKGNNGTISNATRTLGKYGNALSFNGANALVTVADSTSLHLTTAMTLEAWVNPATASSAWRDVIYKADDNYYLEGTSTNGGSPAGGTSGSPTPVYGTSPLPVNSWSHLALTFDGSVLRLYVNGIQAGTQAFTGSMATSANPLQIGGDSLYGQFYNGLIDEVRVYNIALTPTQIQSDMNSPLGTTFPVASLNPASLNFGSVSTGTASTPQNVTLSNPGGVALSISGISITGANSPDFSQSNDCPASLAISASCTITVTFTPGAAGTEFASLRIDDNATGTPHLAGLNGTGAGFSIIPRISVLTPTMGQQFGETGGSGGSVQWAVDGVPGGSPTSGTISTSGLYSPPQTMGTHSVSVTDQGQTSTATVYVTTYPGMVTHHNDNFRTGQNLNETVLTPANVNPATFGKLLSYDLDGLSIASPLYVAGVTIPANGIHNVVYVATEHDSVYAFDADGLSATPLWKTNFLINGATSVPANDTGECCDISPEIGITGTPVIDPSTNTLYVVAKTKEGANYVQRLHALDITTGIEKTGGWPITLQASVPGTGQGSSGGQVAFNALRENQRPALLLNNGVVYIGFGSHGDVQPYHGWILGYNVSTLQQVMAINLTPNGDGAGIWQANGGPAVDSAGNLYVITGNGAFTANSGNGKDYGDSFVKISTAGATSGTVVDYFTPFDQATINAANFDLGAAGPMLLPDQPGLHPHLMVGAGKNNTVYLVDRDNMGHINSGNNNNQIVQSLINIFPYGTPEPGNYSGAVYFNGTVYFGPIADNIQAFQLTNGLLSTSATARSQEVYKYPGATMAISANGSSNGLLWAIQRNGDCGANLSCSSAAPGVLRAYDTSSSGNVLIQVYGSDQTGTRDTLDYATKFSVPLIANGKVFVTSLSKLSVYGLLP